MSRDPQVSSRLGAMAGSWLVASFVACGSSGSSATSDGGTANPDGSGAPASSDDAGTSSDAQTRDDGAAQTSIVAYLNLGNPAFDDECLPRTLPAGDAGGVACQIVLAGLMGDCEVAGLSAPSPAEVALLQNRDLPAGSTCQLDQLPAASSPAAGCSDPSTPGWCYSEGSCSTDAGSQCDQAICSTPAFLKTYGWPLGDGSPTSAPWIGILFCPEGSVLPP